MDYDIQITVDTNDGDYERIFSIITGEELDCIKPLIKAIKETKYRHNYSTRDCAEIPMIEQYPEFKIDVLEFFEDYCPSPEYGFRSIISIEVTPHVKKIILL